MVVSVVRGTTLMPRGQPPPFRFYFDVDKMRGRRNFRHRIPSIRVIVTIAFLATLSGCLGIVPRPPAPEETDRAPVPPPREADRAPVSPPPNLEHLPNPAVRHEPRSATGNNTYTEGGRTFHILPTAQGYDRIGTASWYGTKFHGRRTSSGETYDMFKLTAAHPTLPIPVYARVRNLENGRSTIVRINDRGPFRGGRFIDLSYSAAVKLDMLERGTARVRVTVVGNPAGNPPANPGIVAAAGHTVARYFLEAGAFEEPALAYSLSDDLRRRIAADIAGEIYVVQTRDDPRYRVRIGPFADRTKATRLQALLTFHHGAVPEIIKE